MSDFWRAAREAYEPPAGTGENRRWYVKALYPGPDMPLWVVALLTVSVFAVTVYCLVTALQARNYVTVAFWAVVGPVNAARYVFALVKMLRKR